MIIEKGLRFAIALHVYLRASISFVKPTEKINQTFREIDNVSEVKLHGRHATFRHVSSYHWLIRCKSDYSMGRRLDDSIYCSKRSMTALSALSLTKAYAPANLKDSAMVHIYGVITPHCLCACASHRISAQARKPGRSDPTYCNAVTESFLMGWRL
jgi:hypothetical protein